MATKQATKSKYESSRDEDKVFSEAERAAVAATARERKAASGRSPAEERADGLKDLTESIAKMPPDDRKMGERIQRRRLYFQMLVKVFPADVMIKRLADEKPVF